VPERTSASRGPLGDEGVAVGDEIGDVPVEPRLEPRCQAGRDVRGEHGGGEEDVVGAGAVDDGGERVDARLRQRGGERGVVDDVDRGRAVPARGLGEVADTGAEDDAGSLAQRGRLGEHAERAPGQLPVRMLEEDEALHQTSRFSAR
jgi:hypothetical protein